MRTRYFNPEELSSYVFQNEIATDLIDSQTLARCSIADLIDLCENQKKHNSNLSLSQFLEQLEHFGEDTLLSNMIFVADLDQGVMSETLFLERNPSELWAGVATREIPPTHSLRRLTLKDTAWDFWSDNVYTEMEEFFSEQLNDG